MKALLRRSRYYFSRPVPLILLLSFIVLSITVPLIISGSYTPTPRPNGEEDYGLTRAMDMLSIFSSAMSIVMTTIIFYFSHSIIADDHASHWNMFLATTRIKRTSYVTEKYILVFLLTVILSFSFSVSTVADMIIDTKVLLKQGMKSRFDIKNYFFSVVFIQVFEAIVMSILLPMEFGYVKKKRFERFLTFFALDTVFVIALLLIAATQVATSGEIRDNKYDQLAFAIITAAFSWGMYIVSWLFSKKLYKKRQF